MIEEILRKVNSIKLYKAGNFYYAEVYFVSMRARYKDYMDKDYEILLQRVLQDTRGCPN